MPLEAESGSSNCPTDQRKLRLDFRARLGCDLDIDEDASDLIAQLCTRIDMIMEDTSVIALTIHNRTDEARQAAIGEIGLAAKRISALVAAVEALSP